jgi:hypothetical protein
MAGLLTAALNRCSLLELSATQPMNRVSPPNHSELSLIILEDPSPRQQPVQLQSSACCHGMQQQQQQQQQQHSIASRSRRLGRQEHVLDKSY